KYFRADGLDSYDTARVAAEAAAYVSLQRRPAFLHLTMVRLYGHAGADLPTTYLPKAMVEAEEASDPLLHTVRLLGEAGALSHGDALSIYEETIARVARVAAEATRRPRLKTAADVMASIIPPARTCTPASAPTPEAREPAFGSDIRQM